MTPSASAEIEILADPAAAAVVVPGPEFPDRNLARIAVAPETVPHLNRPLIPRTERFSSHDVYEWHREGPSSYRLGANCYFARNATVAGWGQVLHEGRVLGSREFVPEYLAGELGIASGGSERLRGFFELPTRVIEDPCIVLMTYCVDVYGHLLIELLPQLLLAERALGELGASAKVLLDSRAPEWLLEILSSDLGISRDRIELHVPGADGVVLRRAVLPGLITSPHGLHPFANELVGDVFSRLGLDREPGERRRLFITRHQYEGSRTVDRRCMNEPRLIEIAAEHGFAPVAPETLPWREQVSLYRAASMIVGLYGSGLHNALFSPPATRVAALGVLGRVQTNIGALRGHDNAFLHVPSVTVEQFSAGDATPPGDYTIDERQFTRFIAAVAES